MVNGIKLSDLWLSHSLRTGGEKASPHGAFLLIFCAPRGSGDVICYYLRGGGIMRKILEDIYYDRLSRNAQIYRPGSKYDKAISAVTRLEDRLQKLLPPEHRQDLKD